MNASVPRPARRDVLRWGLAAAGLTAVPALTSCTGAGTSTASSAAAPASSSAPQPVPTPTALTSVSDAEQAAALVLWLAAGAATDGSYGIAGAIVANDTGEVVHTMQNRVLRPLSADVAASPGQTFTFDPTAHGERQLVTWYLQNRSALALPPPEALTVVTSLDPCVMCTGALLTAGFNVGVVAPDTFSGINYTQDAVFADLPEPLRGQAQDRFGYYAVDGGRSFSGGATAAFADTVLTQDTFAGCENVYESSADGVRSARKDSGTDPASLKDPATWPDAARVRQAFRAQFPAAFTVKVKDYRKPDEAVRRLLEGLVRRTPGATNAVAFIDPFGNVVHAAADSTSGNAVATAFMNVTQAYAQTRFSLVDDLATTSAARDSLTSPKYGTFVYLRAPDPRASTTIEDLGAYGSTMEAAPPTPEPSPLQFFDPPRRGTVQELVDVAAALPPLYSSLVRIVPQQVSGG